MLNSDSAESRVAVIGMGNMGCALARALLHNGQRVVVWNRTAEKCRPLADEGAIIAVSPADAVRNSDLIILCLIDKPASEAVLRELGATVSLAGRTLVNLSTGTVAELKRVAALVEARQGLYLDGGIMCYPKDIGRQETAILYSGSREGFVAHGLKLAALGGNQKYLGADPTTATIAYLALYAFYFGALGAYFEGVALAAAAAGISPEAFGALSPVMIDMLVDGIATATNRISRGDYAGDQAPIDVHVAGQEIVRLAAQAAGTPHATNDAFLAYCKMAQDRGFGSMDIARLFDAMAPKTHENVPSISGL